MNMQDFAFGAAGPGRDGGIKVISARRTPATAPAWTDEVRTVARTGAGRGFPSGLGIRAAGPALAALVPLAALVACSSGSAPAPAPAGATCGITRTGANVPVRIMVVKGPVDCAAALQAEQAYADRIKNGDVTGNGGGAPVTVLGWTCTGYPTPRVLRTREASECHTANAEVVAVLAAPPAGT